MQLNKDDSLRIILTLSDMRDTGKELMREPILSDEAMEYIAISIDNLAEAIRVMYRLDAETLGSDEDDY